jgi:hypothetical protein
MWISPGNLIPASYQHIGLIESPLPESFQVQRYRQYHVDTVPCPEQTEGRQENFRQGFLQLNFTPVFKAMNDLCQNLLIYQRRPGNPEIFRRRYAFAAAVICAAPTLKRQSATITDGGFYRNQFPDTGPT